MLGLGSLGLGSTDTALALWLSLGAAVFCVAYGVLKWNEKGAPDVMVAGKRKEARRDR